MMKNIANGQSNIAKMDTHAKKQAVFSKCPYHNDTGLDKAARRNRGIREALLKPHL